MFLLLKEYIRDYVRVYQTQRRCILPSPENKIPDFCQGGGQAAGASIWHRRGAIGTRPLFPHPSPSLLVPAFSSPPTFRGFHQFLDILMNLKLAFSTVGLIFSFFQFSNLIAS